MMPGQPVTPEIVAMDYKEPAPAAAGAPPAEEKKTDTTPAASETPASKTPAKE